MWKHCYNLLNNNKAHVGVLGNETADTLTKEAAASTDTPECYNKVPISVVKSELEVFSVKKWHKGMGSVDNRTNHQTILPRYCRHVKHETKFDPQFHSYGNWTRQHKFISTLF